MRSRGRAKSSVGGEQGKAEREREREREKTKLRERLRRSITSKIMEGLRKHGGYDLPVRADINDVLRALAAEAGWVVEPDGTTYRRAAAAQNLVPLVSTAVAGASSGRGGGYKGIGSSAVAAPPPADQGQSLFSLQSYEGCGAGAGGFPDLLLIGGGVAPVAEAWLPEAWAWGQGAQQNV